MVTRKSTSVEQREIYTVSTSVVGRGAQFFAAVRFGSFLYVFDNQPFDTESEAFAYSLANVRSIRAQVGASMRLLGATEKQV